MDPTSPIPPGAMVEVNPDLIDEGKFKGLIQSKISQALEGLIAYEKETGDKSASAMVTIKLKLERASESHMALEYHAKSEVPVVKRSSFALEANGKLLCQPAGSNDDNPEQQLFYDSRGRVIGGMDPKTGEVIDPPLKIGQA